jgi:hypothetical protein
MLLSVIGCKKIHSNHANVASTITNSSTNLLDWVDVEWNGPSMAAGILSPGISKTIINFAWPFQPDAKITFIDRITRKPYSIAVSFESANEQIISGKCHEVTIRILSYEKADVICE